ncbi:MAG: nuclear transport factor 2 family protein [Verrucomicrobia bacterium]|nr:nuclear transport factor 2 family protein [Verrucomicrobiota bacterium]
MKLVSCILIALFTTAIAFAAPDEATLMAKEKAAWQAFKDKKPDDFKKVVSDKVVAVYDSGMSDMAGELKSMEGGDVRSFELSDYKVTAVSPDVVITTYVAKTEATVDGKDDSGTHNCASVWTKEGGKWMAVFHTDAKQAAK